MKHTQESNPQYFQGILQLRNPTPEIVEFVEEKIEKDGKAWVSQMKEVKNGLDYYLSSNQYLKSLGKMLKQEFPGELKMTATLHTTSKDGRELYRGTVMFKFVNIKKGQVIEHRGDKLEVIGMKEKVLCKDVKTGKKYRLEFKEFV